MGSHAHRPPEYHVDPEAAAAKVGHPDDASPAHPAPEHHVDPHAVGAQLGGHSAVSSAFQRAINFVLPHEEAFAPGHQGDERYVVAQKAKGDAGGLTKYGIDQKSHPGMDIAHLSKAQAVAMYQKTWTDHHLDQVPGNVGIAMFDAYVNGGKPVAWLQNALRGEGVAPTGKLDPQTIAAAQHADQGEVVDSIVDQRDARYDALAKKYPNDRRFLEGWKHRDADLRAYLDDPAKRNDDTG